MIVALRGSDSVSFTDPANERNLRHVLLHSFDSFQAYRHHFERCGVSRQDIAGEHLYDAFARIAPVGKELYSALQGESFSAQRHSRFVIDPSSGTTGTPVLKFTSRRDDDAESLAVRRAFETIGITQGKRCACLDIGASQIYLFYMRVLRDLGVVEPVFIKVTHDYHRACELLRAYDPDVLISIPSVLKRCLSALDAVYSRSHSNLRQIVYIGEPMEEAMRVRLQDLTDASCFSFYGTTEVGSICIECSAHNGMHVPLDLFVPTLSDVSGDRNRDLDLDHCRGKVAWTSLRILDQPVIKYAVHDLVDIAVGRCACGVDSPRLLFNNRVDETFFLFGITFNYKFFLELVSDAVGEPVNLGVTVIHLSNTTKAPSDLIRLTLDQSFEPRKIDIENAVTSVHPLSELMWSKFIRVEVEFEATNLERRKTRKLTKLVQ